MSRVAYNIARAAKATEVTKATIVTAIQDGHLIGRRVEGTIIILRTDLHAWAESLPDYLLTMGRTPESMTR